MKVALVHDYLNQFGGAERVLKIFTEMFPDAPIYTLFYERDALNGTFEGKEIITSFADIPLVRRRHRAFIPFFPKIAETIDLKDKYDLIISSSASFGKGISYSSGKHLSYIHCPLRYAWEPELYLGTLIQKPFIKAATPIFAYLKMWDKKMGKRPDRVMANSFHTMRKIHDFYGRDADVVYPPVDTDIFYAPEKGGRREYYLAFGRILHYKRFDIVVETFNKLDAKLKIVGSGPEYSNVRALASSDNIEFIPSASDEELRGIISGAKALIFPQVEDFGLAAAESLTCGTPVIAYDKGGAPEMIESGLNGILFKEQTPEGLTSAIMEFEKLNFDEREVTKTAERFSKENFKRQVGDIIESLRE